MLLQTVVKLEPYFLYFQKVNCHIKDHCIIQWNDNSRTNIHPSQTKHDCLLQSKMLSDLVIPSIQGLLNPSPQHNARAVFKNIYILSVCHEYTWHSAAYDVQGMWVYSKLHTEGLKSSILTKHDLTFKTLTLQHKLVLPKSE
jgi:hypothetical protein